MGHIPHATTEPAENISGWHRSLAQAIRESDRLIDLLSLPEDYREPARQAAALFPLMVTQSYLRRMHPGNPADPLLRQILPLGVEYDAPDNLPQDVVGDLPARTVPGLLQKYSGRALMIATGTCAVNCRYCFRRHYPYGADPRRLDEWEPAFEAIAGDPSLREIILSGGDPLMLTDARLMALIDRLCEIPHLSRLRIHTRLPIVLPDRITGAFLELLTTRRLQAIVVVHANHPQELVDDCADSLKRLVRAGLPVLNQAVLLAGVNDSVDVLLELCERLVDLGVMPYYLHQLDAVSGTAHFEVAESTGRELVEALRERLPGYAVPRYVREVAGNPYKVPLL